jgi:hypothetical protein
MLAEIFLLRLEAKLRSNQQTTPVRNPRFVPIVLRS